MATALMSHFSRFSSGLNGRTPNELYFDSVPKNERPRCEPRRKWPRDALCAAPWAEVKGRRGVKLELGVRFLEGRRHLPLIELRPAA